MTREVTEADLKEVLKITQDTSTQVNTLALAVARIETQLKLKPELDTEQHSHIITKQKTLEGSVDDLKSNQKWFAIMILGFFLKELWASLFK
jgi:hypothetical protein